MWPDMSSQCKLSHSTAIQTHLYEGILPNEIMRLATVNSPLSRDLCDVSDGALPKTPSFEDGFLRFWRTDGLRRLADKDTWNIKWKRTKKYIKQNKTDRFSSATLWSQRLAIKGAHNHKEGPNPEKTVVEQTLKNNNCGRLPRETDHSSIANRVLQSAQYSTCNQCVSAQRRGCLHVQWAHVVQFILVCQPHCASGPQHWPYLFNQPSQSVTLRSYRRSGLTMLKCPEKKRQKCYHVTVWGLAHYAESG